MGEHAPNFLTNREGRGLNGRGGCREARPCGEAAAVLLVGLLFGLAHGLVQALPVLIALGAGLALIRARTDSVYPCIAVHAAFNAIALASAVAG